MCSIINIIFLYFLFFLDSLVFYYNSNFSDDINELNKKAGLERIKIIAADGPSDYMRRELNAMDEETFELFVKYQLANAERIELLGASSHTVDVLKNTK